MKKKSLTLTDELYQYMLDASLREPEYGKMLRADTKKMLVSALQSPPEETQFIVLLTKMLNAKRILEIGTFTGYTTMLMAMDLPNDGKIIACDIDEKWTSLGREYWEQAGVADKIDLRIAPAQKTLETLIQDGYNNMFDFIFIDADKDNYITYYQLASKLVRIGGIIAIDNVFWNGAVVNELNHSSDVVAIRELNQIVLKDTHYYISMVPIGDGLTLALRLE